MSSNCGAGEDSWESLGRQEIKPFSPKGNQPWIFTGRTEAETPILWPLDAKSWLTGKDPDAGKDWGQEEKEETEDEMVGWHHWLNGHEFEQTPGDGEGQGSLACCSPWVAERRTRLSDWTTIVDLKITMKQFNKSPWNNSNHNSTWNNSTIGIYTIFTQQSNTNSIQAPIDYKLGEARTNPGT